MNRSLQIPGQTAIAYVHHDHDIAGNVTTQINTPNGPEVHTAGGYSRLEAAALEIAKEAGRGAAGMDSEVSADELGKWAAQAAFSLLAECERLSTPLSAVRSALEA